MAKQTYTAGQVLTAAQMTTLQTNDYNQTVSTKTASYTLVAADVGTRIVMNSASATTITVNTSLFAAGDTLEINNIGAGVCTVTAGTATVSSAGILFMPTNGGGRLLFVSTSAAIWFPSAINKVLQIVRDTDTSDRSTTSTSYSDVTGVSVTITPQATTNNILVIATFNALIVNSSTGQNQGNYQITDSANTQLSGGNGTVGTFNYTHSSGFFSQPTTLIGFVNPNSVSAQTYKLRFAAVAANTTVYVQGAGAVTQLYAIELSA